MPIISHIPNISYVIKHDICTGCGICQGACPSHAISFAEQNGKYVPIVSEELCKNEKGCHRCYDACSGVGRLVLLVCVLGLF